MTADPSKSRDERIAAMKARRETAAFAEGGQRVVEQQKAEARRQAEANEARAIANMEAAIQAAVWSSAHDRFRGEWFDMLVDVAADQGCSVEDLDDGRSLEVLDAYATTLRPSKRNAAHVLALYVYEFGLSATDAWARLRRVGGGAR